MSPPAPLSSVLSLPALGQGAQPASSPRPLLVLNPDPPPPKPCKDTLPLSSLSPASQPTPFPPQPKTVRGLSLLILRSCLPVQPTASSMSPSVSHQYLLPATGSQSLPFPSLASGFSIFSPLPAAPPFPWPLPWAPNPKSPSSSSVWPSQPYIVSAGTLSSPFSFLPTSPVWLLPPRCLGFHLGCVRVQKKKALCFPASSPASELLPAQPATAVVGMVLAHFWHAEQDRGHLRGRDSTYPCSTERFIWAQLKGDHLDLFVTKWGDLNSDFFSCSGF